jgi:predicted ATPase/class 3 adenylate cyclase
MSGAVSGLPEGTVTLLFADVEGSTRHLLRLGGRYSEALRRQSDVVIGAVQRNHGYVVDAHGDSSFAAFDTAHDAILAAIDAQRSLSVQPWPDGEPMRVRFGLHTGEPVRNAAGYAGLDVHRAARICTAAHGGQILISQTTRDLIAHAVPANTVLVDLGQHLLKDLPRPEHLIQVAGPGLEREFPPPKSLGSAAGLPPHRPELIGREHQLAMCRALLLHDDVQVLTLTGPGGTGKTSLAIHLAASLMPDIEEGVSFVALAPIADPDLVPQAVARALNIQVVGSRPLLAILQDAIGSRSHLLVLDNFEHLLPAASFLTSLIGACPRLKVVVTSRELLRLSIEHEIPVPPLPLPSGDTVGAQQLLQNEAVRMFVTRAQETRPTFTLTDDIAPIVGEICRRLDGLPLALELAAARIRLLPPRTLLARLDRRLPMLTDGPRDLPARQRTLRDTIGWSYGLLDGAERRVFRLLGVFVGGFTLDAIERIASYEDQPVGDGPLRRAEQLAEVDILDIVASLVDKSLLRQSIDGAETRFSLLETIREFALDQLDAAQEGDAARRRHADFYLELVEEADPRLITRDQVAWLDRLKLEHGNLVAALGWSREAQARSDCTASGVPAALAGLRMAGGLHWFWWLGGHLAEGRRWLDGSLTWDVGEAGKPARLRAMYAAGTLAMIQGSYDDSFRLLDESITLAEVLGDVVTQARCLIYHGIVESYFHDAGSTEPRTTTEPYDRAVELLESTDDSWGKALAASLIGVQVRRAADYARAEAILRRASDLARATGERYLIGSCLPKLGTLYVERGMYEAAEPIYIEALVALREIREFWWSARCLHYLSVAAYGQGNHFRALLLIGSADAILEVNGARRNPREERDRATVVDGLRAALTAATFADTYERGRQLSIDAILEQAFDVPTGTGMRG